MTVLNTAKPATALRGEPASKNEQLCGRLEDQDTRTPSEIQALTDTFGLALPDPVAPFDYEPFPVPTATRLREQAALIRNLERSCDSTKIAIGRCLLAVRQNIEPGQFGRRVAAECRFTVRTATSYMRAAEFVEKYGSEIISDLKPTTIYHLASKSTPPAIVDALAQRAANGDVVSDEVVCAAVEKARVQKREAERKERQSARRTVSKRTKAKWDADRAANELRVKKEAEDRRLAVLAIIESIGKENARHLVEIMRQFDAYELFCCLRSEVER